MADKALNAPSKFRAEKNADGGYTITVDGKDYTVPDTESLTEFIQQIGI